jgi:Immunity protein family (Imm11)
MDYFVWRTVPGKGHCVLNELENFDGLIDLTRGRGGPKAPVFPRDACLRMNPEFPRAVKLADQIRAQDRLIVASARVQSRFRELNIPGVELLAVTIFNHKGAVASPEYAIVNPYVVQDCIDKTASNLQWNRLDPTLISGCLKLVLDESRMDQTYPIFRPKHLEMFIVVRGDVAKNLSETGFSGMEMTANAAFRY